ncbi:hypothetical protein [Zooshikella sp. RANM57]|uniref:hypothetical protein n=1 Tax=Zooshikella sp. RANM57 TaxID=3425863 RepID=UPI003D6FE4B1
MKQKSKFSFSKIFFICWIFLLSHHAFAQGKVVAIISVDWEGYFLKDKDLQKMKTFREDFPEIGLLHFLNAAYYTKADANPVDVTQKIQSVLLPIDEHGLHIHGWRSLAEASNVVFKTAPRAHTNTPIDLANCETPKDCGHEIDISAYNKDELKKIIRKSKRILMDEGFDQPVSFRAGGWMAKSHVIQALAEEGIRYDSSAVPSELLKDSPWEKLPLYRWLDNLWTATDTDSHPYRIRGSENAQLVEIPDNGILADYITAEGMLDVLKKNIEKWQQNPDQNIYVSIGFHQESADRYLDRVREAIGLFEDYTEAHNIPFEWAKLPVSNYFPVH